MNFIDFKPEELIGKPVLYRSGVSYGNTTLRIAKIISITKTGFKINDNDNLFSLINGHQKGLTGRSNMAIVSDCELITEDKANEYRTRWAEAKEQRKVITYIKERIDSLPLNVLKQIEALISIQ